MAIARPHEELLSPDAFGKFLAILPPDDAMKFMRSRLNEVLSGFSEDHIEGLWQFMVETGQAYARLAHSEGIDTESMGTRRRVLHDLRHIFSVWEPHMFREYCCAIAEMIEDDGLESVIQGCRNLTRERVDAARQMESIQQGVW